MGRSRGGLTSKIHLLADSRCRVLAPLTSAGQRHDSQGFEPVMARVRIGRRRAIRSDLRRRGIQAVIPEPAGQIKNRRNRGRRGGRPPAFNAEAYGTATSSSEPSTDSSSGPALIATRDEHDYVWRGTVEVAVIRTWLRNPAQT